VRKLKNREKEREKVKRGGPLTPGKGCGGGGGDQ